LAGFFAPFWAAIGIVSKAMIRQTMNNEYRVKRRMPGLLFIPGQFPIWS